jgi:hypothetical protein
VRASKSLKEPDMTPTMKWAILILMGATIFRAQTILFLPTLEMYGGISPNAWLGPWLSDSIIGLLVPVMIYLLWTKRGIAIWGALVVYNGVGAFDYSQGLIAQFVYPMPAEMASPATVYIGIGLFMVLQLIALALLFRSDVIAHFTCIEPTKSLP